MEEPAEVDAGERLGLLHRLLADYPSAVVSAIDAHGNVVTPDSIQLPVRIPLLTGSPLEVVAPASRGSLVEVLARAKQSGVAALPVVAVDGSAATCHIIDLRPTHGVLVGMIASVTPIDWSSALADRPVLIPRTGQIAKDAVAMILDADQRVCRMLGYDPADLVGMRSLDFIHPDDHQQAIDAWMEMLTSPGLATRLRARHRRADGSWIWMELTNTNRLQHDEACVVCDMIDISDEMAAVEALRQREQLLTTLADALPSGILHLDSNRGVVYSNTRLHRLTGVNPSATIEHYETRSWPPIAKPSTTPSNEFSQSGPASNSKPASVHTRVLDNADAAITMRALTTSEGDQTGAVICFDDITEAFVLRRKLELRATTDELTGCLNRSAVIDALEHTIAAASAGTSRDRCRVHRPRRLQRSQRHLRTHRRRPIPRPRCTTPSPWHHTHRHHRPARRRRVPDRAPQRRRP